MKHKRCLVQFIHPGGEHVPDGGGHESWNLGPHRRKFLVSTGEALGADGGIYRGKIGFWGEWEPESIMQRYISQPLPNGPRYAYRPFYTKRGEADGGLNTDPFVFGPFFFYGICQQNVGYRPTQLRYLEPGSVILFGSCIARHRFVLDTLFVVGAPGIDYGTNYETTLAGHVPQTYMDVTLSRLGYGSGHDFSLYQGAMYTAPLAGMYSFVPCLHYHDKSKGFARPVIELPGYITGTQTQGRKQAEVAELSEMKGLWETITRQIFAQELMLGVSTELPPCRKTKRPPMVVDSTRINLLHCALAKIPVPKPMQQKC